MNAATLDQSGCALGTLELLLSVKHLAENKFLGWAQMDMGSRLAKFSHQYAIAGIGAQTIAGIMNALIRDAQSNAAVSTTTAVPLPSGVPDVPFSFRVESSLKSLMILTEFLSKALGYIKSLEALSIAAADKHEGGVACPEWNEWDGWKAETERYFASIEKGLAESAAKLGMEYEPQGKAQS